MHRPRVTAAAVVTVAALVLTGCSSGARHVAAPVAPAAQSSPSQPPSATTKPSHPAEPTHAPTRTTQNRPITGLVRVQSCDDLLAGLKAEAEKEVTAYGLETYGGYGGYGRYAGVTMAGSTPAATAAGGTAASTGAGSASGSTTTTQDYSATNNQEEGVDEPDLTKTDGHVLAMIRHGNLHPWLQLIEVDRQRPALSGAVRLGMLGDAQLLLDGDLAIAIGNTAPGPDGWQDPPTIGVVVVDISDPQQPQIVRTTTVQGLLVDARFTGGRVLVVAESSPALRFHYPSRPGRVHRLRARNYNRRLIATSTIGDWLPGIRSRAHGAWPTNCTDSYRTPRASGVDAVSVVSIDPTTSEPGARSTVFGGAGTVYASTDALYVATNNWGDRFAIEHGHTLRVRTDIHGFDISDASHPAYLGSGQVPGTILDQYSMSEYDGNLRVATTIGDALPPPGEGIGRRGKLSDNEVTVLTPRQHVLVQVGQVSGLGRGERIYGVRFAGALGYVVTFRQTDPLYVLDLTQPTLPKVTGRLKVTGFSAYLHPLGDGLLFGLGMAVDHHLRETGVQASVFDVSDAASPRLLDRMRYGDSWSEAENDHHQFLWWPNDRIVVLPVEKWNGNTDAVFDAVLHVSPAGAIHEVGRLHVPHEGRANWWPGFQRALVIGGLLYTVSDRGVLASHLDELTKQTWLSFR